MLNTELHLTCVCDMSFDVRRATTKMWLFWHVTWHVTDMWHFRGQVLTGGTGKVGKVCQTPKHDRDLPCYFNYSAVGVHCNCNLYLCSAVSVVYSSTLPCQNPHTCVSHGPATCNNPSWLLCDNVRSSGWWCHWPGTYDIPERQQQGWVVKKMPLILEFNCPNYFFIIIDFWLMTCLWWTVFLLYWHEWHDMWDM